MHPWEIQDQGFLARMTQCSPGHISIQGQEGAVQVAAPMDGAAKTSDSSQHSN